MNRITRLLSSIQLTVCLLLVLAAVMALGTVYESKNGAPAVKLMFWRAAWFDGFLLLLAANIVGCTYWTVPRRSARWAYLLVHQSILVIFAGALIGRWYGQETQIQIAEGDTKSEMSKDANVLKVTYSTDPSGAVTSVFLPTEQVDAFTRQHSPGVTWPVDGGRFSIFVDRYFPDSQETERIVPGGPSDRPAVEVELALEGESRKSWLLARTEPLEVASMLFRLVDGPVQPVDKSGARHSRELIIYRAPDGRLTARLFGLSEIITGPVKVGELYPIKEIPGFTFKVVGTLPNARSTPEVVNRSFEVKQPALRLRVDADGQSATEWVAFGASRTFTPGSRKIAVEYTRQLVPLGFSIKLDKFTIPRHPGSMQPSSYESRVTVTDPKLDKPFSTTIYMNNPLVHRGWTFYQSSYLEGPPMSSVLQVARDPGGPIAYVGFVGFMLGLFCTIWSRARRPEQAGEDKGNKERE